jgi:hypothetical protein
MGLALLVIGLPACFHATIDTGATPSTQVVEKGFASGWIYGLVPPSTVSTAAQCPNGVAKVETQQSFVNRLVGALTLGIYTPMAIKVTCAAPAASASLPEPAIQADLANGEAAVVNGFAAAAQRAVDGGHPVYVQVR